MTATTTDVLVCENARKAFCGGTCTDGLKREYGHVRGCSSKFPRAWSSERERHLIREFDETASTLLGGELFGQLQK